MPENSLKLIDIHFFVDQIFVFLAISAILTTKVTVFFRLPKVITDIILNVKTSALLINSEDKNQGKPVQTKGILENTSLINS